MRKVMGVVAGLMVTSACDFEQTVSWSLQSETVDFGTVTYDEDRPSETVAFANTDPELPLTFVGFDPSGAGSDWLEISAPDDYSTVATNNTGELTFTLGEDSSEWEEGDYEVTYNFQVAADFSDDGTDIVTEDAAVVVSFSIVCDQDEDGFASAECGGDDCEDQDPAISPIDIEFCDGVDNDCDGDTDEDGANDAETFYADVDGDGYGDAAESAAACEVPKGYVDDATDCDDSDDAVSPAGTELCDEIDNDCDETIDEDGASDASTFYADVDGDGFGDAVSSAPSCSQPSGYVVDATDCDDGDTGIYPGATETCDDVDQDCDDAIDEDATDFSTYYADDDGDGYGDASTTTDACTLPTGYVDEATDCDDADATINTAGTEVCDDADNDCDGDTDEDGAADVTTWYSDGDGDGYGDEDVSSASCEAPTDYVDDASDCDDSDSAISPAAAEVCDEVDNDCDGDSDESGASDAATWYTDADGDGYGDAEDSQLACEQPSGTVSDAEDCDDDDGDAYPGADEVCDEVDQDCDGDVDEESIDFTTFYADDDGDGYGDADDSEEACEAPSGFVTDNTDCEDGDSSVSPGEAEIEDLDDQDCDDRVDEDFVSVGDIVITEIMPDPDYVGDATGEWFEVSNLGAEDRDLIGWDVTSDADAGFTIDSSVMVVAGKATVLGLSKKTNENGRVQVSYAYDRSDVNLTNTSDSVGLYMGSTLMDEVSYDSSWPVTAGASLSLDPDHYADGSSVDYWCLSSSLITTNGDLGTPADDNDECPEDTGDTADTAAE